MKIYDAWQGIFGDVVPKNFSRLDGSNPAKYIIKLRQVNSDFKDESDF